MMGQSNQNGDQGGTMPRLLWLIPKVPLPVQDGSRVAITSLIKGLTDISIDLVLLAAEDEEVDFSALRKELGVKNVYVIRREKGSVNSLIKALFFNPLLPITVAKYATRQIKKGIRALIRDLDLSGISEFDEIGERLRWDIIVYEGLHSAAFSTLFGKYKCLADYRTIYRAQNCEADIWKLRAEQERNFFLRQLLKYQHSRVLKLERSVVAGVSGVATVSDDDLVSLKARELCRNCMTVPVGKDFTHKLKPKESTGKIELLFIGRLDWQPNRDGLRWFLENVWGEIYKGLRLRIIGSGDGSWLKRYSEMPELEILGKVPDLEPFYQMSDAVIVPIFYGSGTRVKVIEAASYSKPCIGTELGVSGLGFIAGQHYLKAENVVEWKTVLANLNLSDLERMGERSFDLLKSDYSIESAAGKFVKLTNNVLG